MGKKKNKRRRSGKSGCPTGVSPKKPDRAKTVPDVDRELKRAVDLHRAGDIEDAEAGYLKVLDMAPKHPDALHLMGLIASQRGDFEKAAQLIRMAIAQFPNSDIYYSNLGNALAKLNQMDESVQAFSEALRINPSSVEALNNLATHLNALGRTDEALRHFKRALQINPDAVEVHNNMGNALTDLGQIEAAVECFRKAVALKPDYAIAFNNMGSALKLRERFKEAVESYGESVKADPQYAEAFNNLGEALADMGKPDEAVPFFKRAMELKPDFGLATGNLLYALTRVCDWKNINNLNQVLDELTADAIKNHHRPPEDPFLNLVRHDSPELNFKVATAWSSVIEKRAYGHAGAFDFKGRRARSGKLVIGYLSNNFHDHPMAHLISKLLAVHNRDTVQVLCFSSGRDDGSAYRRRLMEGCDTFIDIRHLNHSAAAECIYAHNVDILVDLMGHTKGNRMDICARRPAPIQARYLGMAGTTGASFFDYLIADAIVVPPSHFPWYSEKIVHLPHCYQVNDGNPSETQQKFTRKDQRLPEGCFVFCSFNQPYKIDPLIFKTWMRILHSVPDSVLWLQGGNPEAEQNLKRSAQFHGVAGERLIFAQRVSKADHLSRLALADLALDTRRVSGAATTSDALWAGVPVIGMKGAHFSSRMSASILKAAGLEALAAEGPDDYFTMADDLAKCPETLALRKNTLKQNLSASPLFDTRRFAEGMESAFLGMWQRYRSSRAPEHFTVTK